MAVIEKQAGGTRRTQTVRAKSGKKSMGTLHGVADHQAKDIAVSDVNNNAEQPIWEAVVEIGAKIPAEEWEKLPDDGSINYRHYLYGAPKRDA